MTVINSSNGKATVRFALNDELSIASATRIPTTDKSFLQPLIRRWEDKAECLNDYFGSQNSVGNTIYLTW